MRRSTWYALALIVAMAMSIGGALVIALVARTGWLGVLIVGLAILVVAARAELDADVPAVSPELLRRRYVDLFESKGEGRLLRVAEQIEQHRWLYIARTVGIALAVLGLNMFIRHQM